MNYVIEQQWYAQILGTDFDLNTFLYNHTVQLLLYLHKICVGFCFLDSRIRIYFDIINQRPVISGDLAF